MKNTVLKDTREKCGLTQVQVAKKAGVSEVSYQRIERGAQEPGVFTAIYIARALNSTVEDLFGAATPDSTQAKS